MIPITTPVPLPADWEKIHSKLTQFMAYRNDSTTPKPPVPLILAGAAFSSAADIKQRWVEFIVWAHTYGFAAEMEAILPPSPGIDVAKQIAGVSADGTGWWPEFGEQFQQHKHKPSKSLEGEMFSHLFNDWIIIVGYELGSATKPLRFAGKKRRRLIVAADPSDTPPWGSWSSLGMDRQAFTKFRKAINDAITPMEIDHITFSIHLWAHLRT